jgi:cytochrome P450
MTTTSGLTAPGGRTARCPNVFEAGLPTLAYHDAATPEQAHRLIGQARQLTPIAMGPYGPEVLTYELARTVLRDPRFYMPKGIGLVVQGITSGPVWDRVSKLIISYDGPEHLRLRRLVSRAFTPRAVERLRSTCIEVITELVDRVATVGRCDVVSEVTGPYPIPIICALLGAPRHDWELFSRLAEDISSVFGNNVAAEESAILSAWDQLDSYLQAMIAARRESLSDDLISDLIRSEEDGDRLTQDELLNLAAFLLVAGTDTSRNQLAAAVQVLCQYPDQWALLGERPDLAPQAVEELMRHFPITFMTLRGALEDVELGDVTIPAGAFVLINTAGANRDPAIYDDPDRLDITRKDPPPMLTFGGGAHYCLGASLARLELVEGLRVITRRLPPPRLAGPVTWRPLLGSSGPTALPVEFELRH